MVRAARCIRTIIGLLLAVVLWTPAQAGEETLTLVSSWNARQNFTAHFLKYVDAVNEAGTGVVRIEFMGGPGFIGVPIAHILSLLVTLPWLFTGLRRGAMRRTEATAARA